MAKIADLIQKRDDTAAALKDIKHEIKELVQGTEMYKAILESTISTVDENGYEVSEKDAASHAFKITLKNMMSK